jgi:uncharacterized protein YeaO (DUF488 family)
MIRTKRSYEKPGKEDGTRILIDRLWPRGMTKQKLRAEWMKDIAPSTDLIKWFGHDPKRWDGFQKKYKEQLKDKKDLVGILKKISSKGTLTLVYSAKDEEHNNAIVLKEVLGR